MHGVRSLIDITEFRSAKVKSQMGTHQLLLISVKILKKVKTRDWNIHKMKEARRSGAHL